MTVLEDLHAQLRALDEQEEHIHQHRAAVMRELVKAAGGLTEAAALLKMDPRVIVQAQRLDEVAMVIYRGPGPRVDPDGRIYGETGEVGTADPDDEQRWADSHWWRIATDMRPKIRLFIVVVQGEVRRIWPVMPVPAEDWEQDRGKVAVPLGEHTLTPEQIRADFPSLGIAVGDQRPMRQGLMREYVPAGGRRGNGCR